MNRLPSNDNEVAWSAKGRWVRTLGTLDLWWVGLKLDTSPNREFLSGKEKARSERLRIQAKRRQFVLVRSALRRILSLDVGCDPLDLEFSESEHGKPFLREGPAFNVSHSGNLALIAVAGCMPSEKARTPACSMGGLGVDVEAVRSTRPLDAIAERFFSKSEAEAYRDLPAAERTRDFYRRWTLKEAYVKALGTGLTYGSRAFSHFDDPVSWNQRALVAECQRYSSFRDAWLFSNGWLGHDGVHYAAAVCSAQPLELRFFLFG